MRFLLIPGAILWLLTTVGETFYLVQYKNTPAEPVSGGEQISDPPVFPQESRGERTAGQLILILLAYPKCPCPRAGLGRIARLMTNVEDRLRAFVVFAKPQDDGQQWGQIGLRTSAEVIPSIHAAIDQAKRETKIFNAQTSEAALFYDRGKRLRPDGGSTALGARTPRS